MEKKITLFSASWCGPCHALKARLKREEIEVDISSIDENMEGVRKFGVKSVPTLVIEENDTHTIINGSDDIFTFLKNEQNSKV